GLIDADARSHRPRADHGGRDAHRGPPRALLRRNRRLARHGAEPSVPAVFARGHGATLALREAHAVRSEKAEALDAVHVPSEADALRDSVRAQYVAARVGDNEVEDYRRTADVTPDSTTETYVALKLMIDNWRWAGVPFYLRTGKALKSKRTEVAIKFKQAPFAM